MCDVPVAHDADVECLAGHCGDAVGDDYVKRGEIDDGRRWRRREVEQVRFGQEMA